MGKTEENVKINSDVVRLRDTKIVILLQTYKFTVPIQGTVLAPLLKSPTEQADQEGKSLISFNSLRIC